LGAAHPLPEPRHDCFFPRQQLRRPTYRRLFDGWRAAGHEVAAIEHFGHDAQLPVDRRWQGMTQQLTTLIDSLAPNRSSGWSGIRWAATSACWRPGSARAGCAASSCSMHPSSTAGNRA
jgi:hypothetical protein